MPKVIQNDEIRSIPLEHLHHSVSTPRSHYDEAHLERLTRSISRRGMLQPPLVRPLGGEHFEVVAGEGRHIAAKRVGLEMIDCRIRLYNDPEDDTTPPGDVDALEDAFIENVIREDLTGLEKAEAMIELVSLQVGESRVFVLERLAVMHNRKRRKRNDVITERESDERILQTFADLGAISWQGFFTNWAPLLSLAPEVKRLVLHRMVNYTLAKRIDRLEPSERAGVVASIKAGLRGNALRRELDRVFGQVKNDDARRLTRIQKAIKTNGASDRVRELIDGIERELEFQS